MGGAVSVDNGIGTAGRLHSVEPEPKPNAVQWPKGAVPFPTVRKGPEKGQKRPIWRGIITTCGEIAGIAAIAAGTAWYSLGAGLITAGIGVFAVSVLAGMPE